MSTNLSDVIALHRGSSVCAPDIRLPLIPPIDESHCRAWGRHLGKEATPWEVRKATPDLWNQIPAAAGLYMFVWRIPVGFTVDGKEGEQFFRYLLYCGQAGAGGSRGTLRARYKTEYSKHLAGNPSRLFDEGRAPGRAELLGRWLLLHPLEYWWTEVSDSTKVAGLEKELIRILAPPLNSQHKLLRPGSRKPAF